jgi:acyl-coenzyme A thioesterase 13
MSKPLSANDLFDISQITGNASDDIKRTLGNPGDFFQNRVEDVKSSIFGESVQKRLKVVEISLNRKAEEEKKLEARVVVELDVTEGQLVSGMDPY